MPPREPKGRLLSREYFADLEFMTEHTAEEREAYILLALFTDDDGYLEWNLGEIAGSLYRYEGRPEREVRLASIVARLAATGRFIDLQCGHARMPRVAKRPRSGSHEYRVRELHDACASSPGLGPAADSSPLEPTRLQSTKDDSTSSPVQSSPIQLSPRAPARGGAQVAPTRRRTSKRQSGAVVPAASVVDPERLRAQAVRGVLNDGWSLTSVRAHLRPGDEEHLARGERPPDLLQAKA